MVFTLGENTRIGVYTNMRGDEVYTSKPSVDQSQLFEGVRHGAANDQSEDRGRRAPDCLHQISGALYEVQAPIRVCLHGTNIDSRTILVTMYYCG